MSGDVMVRGDAKIEDLVWENGTHRFRLRVYGQTPELYGQNFIGYPSHPVVADRLRESFLFFVASDLPDGTYTVGNKDGSATAEVRVKGEAFEAVS